MEHIYRMELPVPFAVETVNVFLVKGESLTLIDTGTKTEKTWTAFKTKLEKIGYSPADIETVVLTHHHADHCGLLDYLPDGIEVIGHPWNEPWITQSESFLSGYQSFFEELSAQVGIPDMLMQQGPSMKRALAYSCKRSLTQEVREGDGIHALPGFTVLETPGHASTHIALYRERDGLLFGGDALLGHISSNPLLEPPYYGKAERAKPLLQYNETLRRLGNMPISRILPGHGSDIVHISTLVEERLEKQELRAAKVLEFIKEKPMTAFELCVQLFPSLYEKELGLTLSETVGQLDFLEYHQQIRVDTSSKQWVYYAK